MDNWEATTIVMKLSSRYGLQVWEREYKSQTWEAKSEQDTYSYLPIFSSEVLHLYQKKDMCYNMDYVYN